MDNFCSFSKTISRLKTLFFVALYGFDTKQYSKSMVLVITVQIYIEEETYENIEFNG